ncbi:endo-1,4-beta-xylanase B [Acidisarcina polymorpha]|uniref:Endo-1,4-beta-xylanase B n=1 Tax=Acidisarcina polymorpha TaxID=2211140 RepID=A0A2Z5G690_9BACT|nr:alpha/beta hydrolase [Acidisarcina polymorpha]AXC14500.1 endo-1,4-beta-xylanase B [Acidisarcina polymorpha]
MLNRRWRLALPLLACLATAAAVAQTVAQETKPLVVPLWPQGAPGALGEASPADQPRITAFPAPKAAGHETHTAVLILPGGAYAHLATDHEGLQVAKWLNNLGVSAFMLEYRLGPKYHHPIELNDAKRGLRWVRSHAAEYGYAPDRIGVWGFSAGGHLASTLGTHFDAGDATASDPIDRLSSRPDFMVLTYPVIGPLGPASVFSFENLIGKNAPSALTEELTNDHHVTAETPTTFLVAADDDAAVFPENSVNFYLALRKAGVPAELHIYKRGGHGFGLAPLDPVLSSWTARLADWLRLNGYLATN